MTFASATKIAPYAVGGAIGILACFFLVTTGHIPLMSYSRPSGEVLFRSPRSRDFIIQNWHINPSETIVVEIGSFLCPHCRDESVPILREVSKADPSARCIFLDEPFVKSDSDQNLREMHASFILRNANTGSQQFVEKLLSVDAGSKNMKNGSLWQIAKTKTSHSGRLSEFLAKEEDVESDLHTSSFPSFYVSKPDGEFVQYATVTSLIRAVSHRS